MTHAPKTLRLLMPEWQGGDYDTTPPTAQMYPLGARLLAFLAPASDAPLVEVPVEQYTAAPRPVENGVVWQEVVRRHYLAARKIIDAHRPDRIVMFGGECLVNQAPFAYLNERYGGDLGLLWIDAHPDISTPGMHDREHAMVLGNLLGHGDPSLSGEVARPFQSRQVLLVGIDAYEKAEEEAIVGELGLRVVPPGDMADGNGAVLRWIHDNGFAHIAVHFDLDALSPRAFYSQLLTNPADEPFDTVAGKLTLPQVARLLQEVSSVTDVVGLGITEHMPWDAYNLKTMMASLPIMR